MDKNYLCIDIASNSIRLLEKDSNGKTVRWGILESKALLHSAIQPLNPARVGVLLRQVLAEMQTSAKKAIFALPLFYVFTVVTDQIDPQIIPAHPKTYKLEALPMKDGRFFLIATPKEIIERYKKLAGFSGLEFSGLELEGRALARNFSGVHNKILLVDPDTRGTTFTVIDSGEIQYVARTDFGYARDRVPLVEAGYPRDHVPHIKTDYRWDRVPHIKAGYVWDVILKIAKKITENKKVDQVLISNSVFNIPNGLQKISS